jgi:hypothetical protein
MDNKIGNRWKSTRCSPCTSCRWLQHRNYQVANTVDQDPMWTSEGPPKSYNKCGRHSAVQNSALCQFPTADRTVRSNRPDSVMLDKTITAAHSVDVATSNSHHLHCTITEFLAEPWMWIAWWDPYCCRNRLNCCDDDDDDDDNSHVCPKQPLSSLWTDSIKTCKRKHK